MKKQLLKISFSFIILMFSVSRLHAQCKHNEILKCYISRSSGGYICRCVKAPHVKLSASGSQSTIIQFQQENTGNVTMQICDITGRLIKTLANTHTQAGPHQITWNAKDQNGIAVGPGIYLLKVQADNYVETKKISVIE